MKSIIRSKMLKLNCIYLFLFLPIFLFAQTQKDSIRLDMREEKPIFPGCEELDSKAERETCSRQKLSEFIGERIKFPVLAKKKNIEGKVIVSFDVETDGSISNTRIVHDIGGGCGVEAVRVINAMNKEKVKWIPGRQQDKAVKVNYNIPINFYYEKDPVEINVYTASKKTKELQAETFLEVIEDEVNELLIRKTYLKKISNASFKPSLEKDKRIANLEMIYCSSIGANMKTSYFSKSGKLSKKMRKKMKAIVVGDMIEFKYDIVNKKGASTSVRKLIYSALE